MFQACIDRLDAISGSSMGIPPEPFHVSNARYLDDEDLWFGRARRLVDAMRVIFDIRNNQPRQLFEHERLIRLDELVHEHMNNWKEVNEARMENILIDTIMDVQFDNCNRNFNKLFIAWVFASITLSLARYNIHHDFIPSLRGHQNFRSYMYSESILSSLLLFPETFVFDTENTHNRKIRRRMNVNEIKVFTRDFMAYIQLVLLPEDIELLVKSLTSREQEKYNDAMA